MRILDKTLTPPPPGSIGGDAMWAATNSLLERLATTQADLRVERGRVASCVAPAFRCRWGGCFALND